MTATNAKGVTFNFCPICADGPKGFIVDVRLGTDGQIYCYNKHKLTGDRNIFELRRE